VWFDGARGAELDARTGGGQIEVEHRFVQSWRDAEGSRLRGELNGGGASLIVRTMGGDIRLLEA
jgi:hypothetical protein